MHIGNYERPHGCGVGSPEVLVAPNVVDRLGVPIVDYDGLHQFMTDDLGVPYGDSTTIKLFGRVEDSGFLGFHLLYTRTVHINAPASEKRFCTSGGVMRVLAHEGRHRSDSTNRKLVTAAEMAGGLASYKLGYDFAEAIPLLSPVAILVGLKSGGTYYRHIAPEEKRARIQEMHPSTLEHRNDITFPLSPRTRLDNIT